MAIFHSGAVFKTLVFLAGSSSSLIYSQTNKSTDSQRQTVVPKATVVSTYTIYDVIEKSSSTVDFEKGKSSLSDAQKAELATFLAEKKAQAAIDKLVVAAWSDQDYPPNGDKLGKGAIDLAQARADAVEQALQDAQADNVEVFLMTERPNWFQKVFATEGAEIKGKTKAEWLTNEEMVRAGERLRAKGGPGKVVVLVMFEGQVIAH
jgi:hypothetical protein